MRVQFESCALQYYLAVVLSCTSSSWGCGGLSFCLTFSWSSNSWVTIFKDDDDDDDNKDDDNGGGHDDDDDDDDEEDDDDNGGDDDDDSDGVAGDDDDDRNDGVGCL